MELSGVDFAEGPRINAWDLIERARAASGPDGRLDLPKVARWPIFPFEVDELRVRQVEDPVVPEPARHGETAEDCTTCATPDSEFVWTDARWRVSMPAAPESLPCLTVHPRAHLDLGDLTEEHGAELGALLVRAQRALASIEGVGSVHIYKWGDGAAHLHVVLVARPRGMLQLKGMYLTTWMFTLPPLPEEQWQDLRRHLASVLDA